MSYIQPFFLLMGRASVFWVGIAVLASLAFVLAALGQPDEILLPYVNAAFLAALGFPMACGWLGGAIIQEFQHCSCAWSLPGVNQRLAAGYLSAGIVITLVVAGLVSQSQSNQLGFVTLWVLALGGYCLGGTFFDPLRPWMGNLSLIFALLIVARSRYLSELVGAYPGEAIIVSAILGTSSLARLFSRSVLRKRPFQPTSPFPGSYSVERAAEFERQKLAASKRQTAGWRSRYLADNTGSWSRAAIYEGYGPLGWKILIKIPTRLWALGLVFAVHAWANRGDLSYGQALGRTLFEAIFQSPHVPPLVERGEHAPIVILVVAAMGVATTLSAPPSLLKTSLAYPISRRLRARVAFRTGLFDIAVFYLGVGLALLILGLLCGWLIGYDLRLDFIPYFVRPLSITAILMPLALWGQLQLYAANRKRSENTVVAVIFGVIGFAAAVWIATALWSRLLPSPVIEIVVLAALLAGSLLIYRRALGEYFTTHDVV